MNWKNMEEIAKELEDNYSDYSDEEINELSLREIEEMVKSSSEFEDHETIVTKELLNDTIEAWLEYRGGR